ncbi:ceramide glucosyltransferase-like [Watersipora subatra]|uniref:ceramide glucosyltransferase-like n=1 Tax=Watersipora subatra TaxID=2589382 RepID=UPI00355B4A77
MAHSNISLLGLDWILIFSWIAFLLWSAVLVFYLISIAYSKLHLHRPLKEDAEKGLDMPGVSIVKPLNGLADPNLVDNLTTYFTLNYPKYELLFCIQDSEDHELIKVLNGLFAKYPQVDAKLFKGAQNVGVNPKVNNMMNGYEAAQYPLFLISDAGVRMSEDSLTDMVLHMTEKVGLVHQLPMMLDGELTFSRVLEKVYFGGAHARVYVSANAVGINCMTSMSCLFRKKILDEEGGLESLSSYLGEDFFLAQLINNKGWRVVLSSQPAQQNPGLTSLSGFKARMSRWTYLRWAAMPQLILLEPLTEHAILGPIAALAVQYLFAIPIYISLPAHFLCWCIMDYILASVLENHWPRYSIFSHVKAWVFRELLILYLLPTVISMRHVSWGGSRFRIRFGGRTEKIVNGDSHSHRIINI